MVTFTKNDVLLDRLKNLIESNKTLTIKLEKADLMVLHSVLLDEKLTIEKLATETESGKKLKDNEADWRELRADQVSDMETFVSLISQKI